MTKRERDDFVVRLTQYERLIERTGPTPAGCRCTCDRCVYGVAPPLTRARSESRQQTELRKAS